MFGDNKSILSNSSKPYSVLKNKSLSIAYHFVREGVAKNERRISCLNMYLNPTDMFSKSLPSGEKRALFTVYLINYH